MSFQQFLESRAGQPSPQERRGRRDEWVAAVRRLIDQLRAWLAESDPKQLLDVVAMQIERVEPGLGSYMAPSLRIGLDNAAAQVVPIGRNVSGVMEAPGQAGLRAEGRVDLTNGIRKYILYRALCGGQECWYALDERFQAAPLDRARLEAILQDLLE